MDFVYSFIKKPKKIFLVHGEPEGQIELKQKIIENTKIPVTIPDFGDVYELNEDLKLLEKMEVPDRYKYIRLAILERVETLKEEIEDMGDIIKETMLSEDAKDTDLAELNEKVKELEKQIVNIIED